MTSDLWVRVPASTSNLGPGFDCLGLAVDRYLTLVWRADGQGVVLTSGERPPAGFGDRLAAAIESGPAALGLPGGGSLEVHSDIPVGRGLGSSAALSIGLEVLRSLVAGQEPDTMAILDQVTISEGHPDNAAPSVHGGLVSATLHQGNVLVTPLDLSAEIGWAWSAPTTPSDTESMREALPVQVDHAAAIRNASRLAQLIPALATGDSATLAWAMDDELHVPCRLPLIPGGSAAQAAALQAGAWGCTISGAGSGLIAATSPSRAAAVASAMAEAFREVDPDPPRVSEMVLRVDRTGAVWGTGEPAGFVADGPRPTQPV